MKSTSRLLSSIPLLFIFLVACQGRPIAPAAAPDGARVSASVAPVAATGFEPNLTQEYASFRAGLVSHVSYDLKMDLANPASEDFGGEVGVTFQLSGVSDQLALDFRNGGQVLSLRVNGSSVEPNASYRDGRISLPAPRLRLGVNNVVIAFRQKFSKQSTGFYRFKDPEDGRVYLWTQFEPFYANYMFPCFDQPDLKANYVLQVKAPQDWEVISTARETQIQDQAGVKVWNFPATPAISSYLFSLHAGPYQKWTASAGDIPLRIFARRSLAKYVKDETEAWFSITRAGLKFYGSYFDYAYPFKKYDQVIAPDFEGAMENVAAVTFSEDNVVRGAMTRNEREELANVILHEMAHMWFGDLVTMQWWNDLWLNESFATYMSTYAETQATEFKDAWLSFHGEKARAYREDQLLTTHAIEGQVPDTRTSLSAFDSITYGKGASVLKQLAFFLGADNFRDGVRSYFKSYAFRNTRLEDFMTSLGEASHRDLLPWSRQWLLTSGVDAVRASLTCEADRVKSAQVLMSQAGADPSALNGGRPHRTRIELDRGAKLSSYATVDVELRSTQTDVKELVGKACPALVLPNSGDYDYAKVRYDDAALAVIRARLAQIEDPLNRLTIWTALFDQLRDGALAPQIYLLTAENALKDEKNLKIVADLLRTLHSGAGRTSVLDYLPSGTSVERAERSARVAALENVLWLKFLKAPSSSDAAKIYLDGFVRLAESTKARERLFSVLEGRTKKDVDQDRRWEIVARLAQLDQPNISKVIADEKSRDGSERGLQMALAAEAAIPIESVKQKWFSELSVPGSADFSLARRDTVLRYFLPPWQDRFRKEFAGSFYDRLLKLTTSSDQELVERYARYLVPVTCDETSAKTLGGFIDSKGAVLQPSVLKLLRNVLQEDERCVRLRDLAKRSE